MIRTQIRLSPEQHRKLKRWAKRIGISLAEAVRRCVADRLSREESACSRAELAAGALSVCGKYEDPRGSSRVGLEHDGHLVEAYGSAPGGRAPHASQPRSSAGRGGSLPGRG